MTVKSFTEEQKTAIANQFSSKILTLDELVFVNSTSRRTMMRILNERGVAPATHKRIHLPKVKLVHMPVMTMQIEMLDLPLKWHQKIIQFFTGLFTKRGFA